MTPYAACKQYTCSTFKERKKNAERRRQSAELHHLKKSHAQQKVMCEKESFFFVVTTKTRLWCQLRSPIAALQKKKHLNDRQASPYG
jgi:hypothetical protein